MKKRVLSLFLVFCMTLSLMPTAALAAELENRLNTGDESGAVSANDLAYSNAALALSAESCYLDEDSGRNTVTLTRGGDITDEATFTVVAYDNNANYGEDYRILYNDETVEKIKGAGSVYDAFRDGGELTDGISFDLAVWAALSEGEQDDETQQDVSAAAALSQLDELNAKAVEFEVTFAAGVRQIYLTIEVMDDNESEYEESFFMAVLDAEGEMVEEAMLAFAIVDDEVPGPSVTVGFDCEEEMVLTDGNDSVELTFFREGDLDTTTLAVLYLDGQPLGQVDFVPWQAVQTVDAVVDGVYTLSYSDGTEIGGQVEVFDNRTSTQSVADGADPILDAIPDEYAVIRPDRRSSELDRLDWLPGWATGSSYENEDEKIILGYYIDSNSNNNIFKAGGNSSKGSVSFFVDNKNIHEVSTSGNLSYVSTGRLWADSVGTYDFTGVESVESMVYTNGVDHKANISIGVQGTVCKTIEIEEDSVSTLIATLPDKFQGTKYVYYSNEDPDDWCGGTNMFVPNGFKMNLRNYRFLIEDNSEVIDPEKTLTYSGGTAPGHHVPRIDDGMDVQYKTINSVEYGTNKYVDICYTSDSQYPAKLVGYKLKNDETLTVSDVIWLSDDGESNGTGSASIRFDADFLKKYEETYCYKTISDLDKSEAWTFHIIPVYEKIEVNTPTILPSDLGNIKLVKEESGHCLGDMWVFEADENNSIDLSGIWFQAMTNANDNPVRVGVSQTRYKDDENRFILDIQYPRYSVQGVFSADAARLLLSYAEGAKGHGTIETSLNGNNEAVSPEQYVVGDYIPLIAKPNDDYVTRWKVGNIDQYYYGNVFYYKLDGNSDHNIIYVDFVPVWKGELNQWWLPEMSGTLTKADVEARLNGNTEWVPMPNTTITITSDQTYTAVTDDEGNFTISGFNGVYGGTYSVAVLYDEAIGYTSFTYQPDTDGGLNLQVPQFATGVPYPTQVLADVNGSGQNQNMLSLVNGGTVNATARVYVPPKNYTITDVNFYFIDPDQVKEGADASSVKKYSANCTGISGDESIWSIKIADASELSSGLNLYVEVISEKNIYLNNPDGSTTLETTSISSGLVNTGYGLTTKTEETFPVKHTVPSTPSMQSAGGSGFSLDDINIPVLGKLDFGLTSKTGGFFSQRTDNLGNTVLICGHSYLASFGTGTVGEKLEMKQKTANALDKAAAAAAAEGAANADVTAVSGSTAITTVPAPSKWTFSPAFLFKFTFSPKSDGSGDTYLSRYEMALGVDVNYMRNIPFSVYGVPFYVCLIFTTEAYFDVQAEFAESTGMTVSDVSEDLLTNGKASSVDSFIAAPVMKFVAKGGVGYNAFLSLFLSASVSTPFIIEVYPNVKGAFDLSFTVSGGADLVLFTAEVSATVDVGKLGYDDEIKKSLDDLKPLASGGTTTIQSTQALRSSARTADLEEMLNGATFAPMVRTVMRRAFNGEAGTIATNVFKNTGVHLLKLDDDSILAFYLQDNNREDTLNYLTVSYARSDDGGKTWSDPEYVSDNTKQPNTSLQFDINLFELEDRTLVTWSEANFDKVVENLEGVDINELTPAQISMFMNAMDLKGRFFDENGEPMGEAFTIAENSTVACGALDAVQNDDMVYVYYQRNSFPYDETNGEIELIDLLSTERTICIARAEVSGSEVSEWTSSKVTATNKNGQEYRITEVEPFVHDGVMGEILVLDRDGKLAEWNEETESWDPSNEDRQLYLRTYTFDDETGEPVPSALLAITDSKVCAQSPQVVSSDDYLHLIWNQDGKVVYVTDFVATWMDNEDVQSAAYVVVDQYGDADVPAKVDYIVNDLASDDEHFHIGTTFSASMDNEGHVLLNWVATDPASEELTNEIYGVVLETVSNAVAMERSNADTDHNINGSELEGNANIYQLFAKGSPVALTDEDSLIGALDSVFLNDEDGFLLAFSKLDHTLREFVESADIKAVQSVYESSLEITGISAPEYPMPGGEMSALVTVTNKGLGTAENVEVTAKGVGHGTEVTIDSILPGRSQTVELTMDVPDDFDENTTLTVTAGDSDSEDASSMDIFYGPYFEVREMPVMSSVPGTSSYRTETMVYNAGNAAGVPTLNYQVGIFASSQKAKEYSHTAQKALLTEDADEAISTEMVGLSIEPGGTAVISYLLEDTPVTADKTGNLTVMVDTGEKELGANQFIQGQMPKLKLAVTKADLEEPAAPVQPGKPSSGNSSSNNSSGEETQEPVFVDVPVDSWYHEAVSWAVKQNVTAGTGANTFGPELECSRKEAVTFLWRCAGCPKASSRSMTLTDVPTDAWYREAVLWAVENGITAGTGDNLFSPDMTCTRAQIVAMIYRMEQACGGGFTGAWMYQLPFTDVPEWAFEAVAWCYKEGITAGISDTSFGSDEICTRAQIVTLLYRFMNK